MHRFTVGRDPVLDLNLYAHDCIASAAHVRMLHAVDLLSKDSAQGLLNALLLQHQRALDHQVTIFPEQEDGHTALEAALIEACGDDGKRVHVARSRNDQVLVALRLYLRSSTTLISQDLAQLISVLLQFAEQYRDAIMPGYTHMRAAMPSSFDMWAGAFAEGLLEELDALEGLFQRFDRCPLGAAAGFGVPITIDRKLTASLLGFSRVQHAPIDCMNSRGRHEQALLDHACSIAGILEKLLWDLALYSTDEYGFVSLPDAFTTGSSIMPQKRNPDVIELARAKCRELRGLSHWHRELISGLPSSYHRDLQLAKAPLMDGVQTLRDLLAMLTYLIPHLHINAEHAKAACTDELYATQAAYQLVKSGTPFRDAYRQIAGQIGAGSFDASEARASAMHDGKAAQQLASECAQLQAELATAQKRTQARIDADNERLQQIWNLL
jgi:argininosuccinate lyase